MFPTKGAAIALSLSLIATGTHADSDELVHGGVVPLYAIPSGQWLEKVVGDMDKPGQTFAIRIHHDARYVVLPHTHPEDKNITVLTGSGALGRRRTWPKTPSS